MTIPIVGKVLGDLNVYPRQLFFGVARPGKTNRKSLTLSRLRGGPLEIKRVNATSEHVKTELVTLDAGATYQINVFLDSTNAPEGDFGDTLVVETNSPNQPKIEVPVYAKVRSKPVQ